MRNRGSDRETYRTAIKLQAYRKTGMTEQTNTQADSQIGRLNASISYCVMRGLFTSHDLEICFTASSLSGLQWFGFFTALLPTGTNSKVHSL